MVAAAATHTKHDAPAPLLCLFLCDPLHRVTATTASAASAALAMAAAVDNDEESFRSATAPSRTPSLCVPAATPLRRSGLLLLARSVGSRGLACATVECHSSTFQTPNTKHQTKHQTIMRLRVTAASLFFFLNKKRKFLVSSTIWTWMRFSQVSTQSSGASFSRRRRTGEDRSFAGAHIQ